MRSTLLAVCLLLTSVSAFAQETRYRLERIIVEGSRVDDDIVRAEARLPEERSYTDADFREAVYRVRRLPFVTDATYRLEPGVTGGGTTLVIRILDVTPVFYDLDLSGTRRPDGETDRDGSALLGGRFFLHNLGILETAVQDSDELDGTNLAIAYRAYDIMGTGGFGTVSIAKRFRSKLRDYSPTMVLGLGYPITRRQTVTLDISRSESSVDRDFDLLGDDDGDDETEADEDDNFTLTDTDKFDFATLRWWYESIDDPFFATRGVSIAGGPQWASSKGLRESFNATTRKIDVAESETVAYGLALDASGYRRLFGRNVAFLRLHGDASQEDESEIERLNGSARVGLAHDFHSYAEGVLRPFKARLEVGAGYRKTEVTVPDGGPEFNADDTFAEAAFVLRHSWGTVRLTGTYVNEE